MSTESSSRRLLVAAGSVVCSALIGGISAVVVIQPALQRVESLGVQITQLIEQRSPTSPTPTTSSTGGGSDVYPGLPVAFRSGRASPTIPVFLVDAKTPVDELLHAQSGSFPAVSLTSDGWLVTSSAALRSAKLADIAVGWKGRLYTPTQGIRDTASGLVYLKIGVTDLPPAALASPLDLELGQPVWLESMTQQYAPNTVVRYGMTTGSATTFSSDQWNRRYILAYTSYAPFASVWNERGQLVGFAESGKGEVLPAEAIRTALTSLLARGEIRRPSLGVRYVDLRDTYRHGQVAASQNGALVRGDKQNPIFTPTSPAKAMLKEGDVIERIDRDILDGTWTLGERVLEYLPGSTVTVAGTRQGKPFEATITFQDVVTSEVLK